MKKIKSLVAMAMTVAFSTSLLYGKGMVTNAKTTTEDLSGSKPNIVFMLIDDMGYTDTSLYGSGYYETPNLERLAEEGIMFTDAYAGSNLCSPSRATILTGRYSTRNGVDRLCQQINSAYINGENPTEFISQDGYLVAQEPAFLPKDEITIPELLKDAGYKSAHIGKWHLGDPNKGYGPLDQGYDINIGGYHAGQPPTYFSPYNIPGLENGPKGEYLTDRLTDEAINFIKENKDEPFFLNLAHYGVHTPLQGKPELVKKYQDKPKTETHKNPTYAAMVESVDDSLGRIMDTLEELGIDDNTIVVFTSDNGGVHYWDVSNNYPLREGKCFNYEGGNRIPAVISWKGKIEGGKVSNEPIHHSDYLPTFSYLAGVETPKDRVIDGENLTPLLIEDKELEKEALYWFNPHFNPGPGKNVVPAAAIREGDLKLIKHFEESTYADGKIELFNLKEDMSETTNLASEMPEKAKDLENKLNKWLNETESVKPVKQWTDTEEFLRIDQKTMTATATSEESTAIKGQASRAIDNNTNTFWHTVYGKWDLPQSITIDLGKEERINKLSYFARQDIYDIGRIKDYTVHVSKDGVNFIEVDKGTWENTSSEKLSEFEAVDARYIKLTALSGVGNYAAASEINIFKAPEVKEVENAEVTTEIGLKPMLPETINAVIQDYENAVLDVEWLDVKEEDYNKLGSFEVEGRVKGTDIKTTCVVSVEDKPNHKDYLIVDKKQSSGEFEEIKGTENISLEEQVSLEFTVKPEEYNGKWQNIIGKIDDSGNGFQVNISPEGRLVFHADGSIIPDDYNKQWRAIESKEILPTDEWTDVRIAFSSKASRVRLYINDKLEGEKIVINPLEKNKNAISIGAKDYKKNGFKGELKNIKVYNKFIIDKDLTAEFEAGDFNKDGKIDIGDLSIASKNYGKAITEYDLNNNGIVDLYELTYISDRLLKN